MELFYLLLFSYSHVFI